jgi:hypothetical protein
MDGNGDDYVKWRKQASERQLSLVFSHMYNLK